MLGMHQVQIYASVYIQILVFTCHIMQMYANCDSNDVANYGCLARKLSSWFYVRCEAVHQRHTQHTNSTAYYCLSNCLCMHHVQISEAYISQF
jgi:hypothetical protein